MFYLVNKYRNLNVCGMPTKKKRMNKYSIGSPSGLKG
jgi:hypothetical protein